MNKTLAQTGEKYRVIQYFGAAGFLTFTLAVMQENQVKIRSIAQFNATQLAITDDNKTVANLVPALYPEMMPVYGSDPVAAVALARRSAPIFSGSG